MAKPKFTEPELYLLGKWREVHQLELEMQDLRLKYYDIFDEVLERVGKKHAELNWYVSNCHKRPKDEAPEEFGYINVGIGREEWPSWNPNKWPTGFWIGGVLLEELHLHAR